MVKDSNSVLKDSPTVGTHSQRGRVSSLRLHTYYFLQCQAPLLLPLRRSKNIFVATISCLHQKYSPATLSKITSMEPTTLLIWAFIALSLVIKFTWEKIELFLHSNFKYRVINYLASYIYYGDDIGVKSTLQLDSPSQHILERRLAGQKYLESKLSGKAPAASASKFRGPKLSSSLVDCRFALAKVCMPLLRELEFPNAGRNFVRSVCNNGPDGKGMIMVTTEDGMTRPFVGNDAVQTFSVKSFYAPVQNEINRRMSLNEEGNKDAMLRFSPLSMNSELDKNVSLIKKLTGLDKVRYSLSGKYI